MRSKRNNKEVSKKIVMVYRKSTNEEDKQTNSFEMQRSNALNFSQKHGLEIVAEVEESDSGTLPLSESTGLLKSLELASQHHAAFIGFDRFDRAARNLPRYFHFKSLAQEMGAKVLILSEGMPKEDEGNFSTIQEIMQGFLAEHSVKLLRERVKQGLAVKKARGEKWCRNATIGHKWDETGKLVRDEAEESTIAKIKSLSEAGLNTVEICNELAKIGAKNRRGNEYKPMSVWNILKKVD